MTRQLRVVGWSDPLGKFTLAEDSLLMAIPGRNASWTRLGSPMRRWTMGSVGAPTRGRCSASATGWARGRSRRSSGAGSVACLDYVYDLAFRQFEISDTPGL